MANSLLTISMITRYAIKLFMNTNAFLKSISRQYDDQYARDGAKIGSQLRIRLPNDYTVTDGPGISIQDTAEQQIVLTVATQRHVDVAFTSAERTLSMDDYAERVILPRVNVLAGNVANQVITNTEGSVCNFSANLDGANNILPVTAYPFLNAGALLDDNSAPLIGTVGERKIVNDPHTDARATLSLQGLLNPATEISQQFRSGTMKNGLGFTWMRDQTVLKHTAGTATSATLNGANQTGTVLTLNALSGTLLQGDIVTIAGVNAVNRVTKASTGQLRQFVVTANVANAGTSMTVYPAIVGPASATPYAGLPYTPSQYQTVAALNANGATITPVTNASVTYRKSLAYAPEAITWVCADLWTPTGGRGVVEAARHVMDNVSMRGLVVYSETTDQPVDRLDCLFGSLVIRGEWMCAVADAVP